MSNDKTFAFAGVSRKKPGTPFKVRWTNDADRKAVLEKDGQVDIDLVQLPYAMTKIEAAKYLKSINFGNGDADVGTSIDAAISKYGTPASTTPEGSAEVKTESTETVIEHAAGEPEPA